MIIRWSQKYFTFRYLPMEQRKAVSLFFQGGNVGFRRKVFDTVGNYDPVMNACEDVDMGIRFSEEGKLFSQPSARVTHTSNFTLKKIVNQWWLTAIYQVKIMRKISGGGIEIFSNTGSRDPEATDHQCWMARPLPFTVIIFLSSFLMMNLSLGFLVPALIFGCWPLAIAACLALAVFGFRYFRCDFTRDDLSLRSKIRFCLVRLLINEILILVSFLQGLRERMIYVSHEYSAV